MKLFRLLIFIMAAILLAGGYLVSQIAYAKSLATQDPTPVVAYAERVDVPVFVFASLIVIVACIVFTLFQEPKEEGSD